jgi:arylsulfatase A-like enzyme
VARQVQTLDLLPTVLGLLETSPPDGPTLEGRDLTSGDAHPFAVAEQSAPDLRLFGERFPGVDVSRFDRALAALRTNEFKFIWASDGRHELFDLEHDPTELVNVIDERPDIAAALFDRLGPRVDRLTPPPEAMPRPEFEDAVAERLRSLGYLE